MNLFLSKSVIRYILILVVVNSFLIIYDYVIIYLVFDYFSENQLTFFNNQKVLEDIIKTLKDYLYLILILRIFFYIIIKKFEANIWYKKQHEFFNFVLHKILKQNPSESTQSLSGFQQALINDCQGLVNYFYNPLTIIITESISVLILVILISYFNIHLLLFLVVFTLIIGIYFKQTAQLNLKLGNLRRTNDESRINSINEIIKGYFDFLQYHKLKNKIHEIKRFDFNVARMNIKQSIIGQISRPIIESLGYILFISFFILTRKYSDFNLFDFLFMLGLIVKTLPSFNRLNNSIDMIKYGQPGRENLKKILSVKELEENCEVNNHFESHEYKIKTKQLIKHFDEKSIKYKDSFEFYQGMAYLLRGNSGTGKSTLLKILSGIIKANKGQINYYSTKKSTPIKITYVGQEIFLFKGTIMENVAFSNPSSEDEVKNALNIAGFPDIYALSEIVEEDGKNFSGGQRQRIAIARAILQKSDVIILDESISGLEEGIQSDIIQKLKHLASLGKIIIISVHTSKHDKLFDKIYEL